MNKLVKDVMTAQVVYAKRDATYKALAARMRDLRVSGFPVVDDAGRVVGVISESDMLCKEALSDVEGLTGVVSAFLRHKDSEKAGGVTAAELMTSPAVTVSPGYLMDPRRFPVTVKDGIVTLHGEPETADLGHRFVRTVRHLQGVVAVRDRLTYPEPALVAAPGLYVNH
jgi:CBS domain-containing protein